MNYDNLHLTLASVAVLLAAAIVVMALMVRRQRQTIRKRLAIIEREQAVNDQMALEARQQGLDPDAPLPPPSKLSAQPLGSSNNPKTEQLTIHFKTTDSL